MDVHAYNDVSHEWMIWGLEEVMISIPEGGCSKRNLVSLC